MFRLVCVFVMVVALVWDYSVPVAAQDVPVERDLLINRVGLEASFASLEKNSTISGTVRINDIFKDDAVGFGLYVVKDWTDNISQVYGWSFVEFGGKSFTDDTGDNLDFDDISANAYYTGIVFHTGNDYPVRGYVQLDLGVSSLSDIGYTLRDTTGTIDDKGFSGGMELYHSFGIGAIVTFSDRWSINLGYKLRNFGELGGENRTLIIKDYKIVVSSFNVNLLYSF